MKQDQIAKHVTKLLRYCDDDQKLIQKLNETYLAMDVEVWCEG